MLCDSAFHYLLERWFVTDTLMLAVIKKDIHRDETCGTGF